MHFSSYSSLSIRWQTPRTTAPSGKQHQGQGNGTWNCLYPKDLPIGRESTEYTGESNAGEKENLDWISAGAESKTPYQSCSEKAVVQPLIRGQGFGCRSKLGGKAESSQAARLVPEEHLQDQKINMQESDQGNNDIRDCRHLDSSGTRRCMKPELYL